ncbi:hypothetical protein ABVR74_06150 [Lactococcus lactis subsp. lactis]|uniref:coiled-coil domain-containing protein n=1 Tax=Lactococcus lactis TaxID=1358 RepID=UPI00338D4CA2
MVQIFVAYRNGESITAYQAIKLKNYKEISTAFDQAELFDHPDPQIALPVFPKSNKNGTAYFSHYSETPPELRKRNGQMQMNRDMSLTHKLYAQVFSRVRTLKIAAYQHNTSKGQEITLHIRNAKIEAPVREPKTGIYYFIDVLLELEATSPYHWFYQWNGRLALEIKVTHPIDREKRDSLNQLGFQIFEIGFKQSTIKKIEEYNKQKLSEEDFNRLIEVFRQPFKEGRFVRSGRMLGEAHFLDDFEEQYHMIFGYEAQKEELEKQMVKLTFEQKKLQDKIKSDTDNLEQELSDKRQAFNSEFIQREIAVQKLENSALTLVNGANQKKSEIEKTYSDKENELKRYDEILRKSSSLEKIADNQKYRLEEKDKIIASLEARKWYHLIFNNRNK